MKIIREDNTLVLSTKDVLLKKKLKQSLSFVEVEALRGYALTKAKRAGLPTTIRHHRVLYTDTCHGDLATPSGFLNRIVSFLAAEGVQYTLLDKTKKTRTQFEPDWKAIEEFELRPYQLDVLKAIAQNEHGVIDCPTAFGKTFIIALLCRMYPKATFTIVSKAVTVVRDTIYPRLVEAVGNCVGVVGGGKSETGKRVTVVTAASLGKANLNADFLIGDEVHELASDSYISALVQWPKSRNYGFTASHNRRADNKDNRVEGVFGPVISKVSFKSAKENNMVTPIQVVWREVNQLPGGYDIDDFSDVELNRFGLWVNSYRNKLIAEDAAQYDDKVQTLIVVGTLQHAVSLKHLLPEFTLVYNGSSMTGERRRDFIREGFIDESEPVMNPTRYSKLVEDFTSNKLKKVIATGVWNVGVSFNHLQVLIRADGLSSKIASIQIPGRAARLLAGKSKGIVHDYIDNFSRRLLNRSKSRKKIYTELGFEQVFPSTKMSFIMSDKDEKFSGPRR
jgi:superfamily II DNA or RNA helicase